MSNATDTEPATRDRYVIETPRGYTETFSERQVQTLVALGLVRHIHDGYLLLDGQGRGVGGLCHFYGPTQ